MSKKEKYLKLECAKCNTQLHIPISELRIISTDQCAGFIEQRTYRCEKCNCSCIQNIVELDPDEIGV